MKFKTTTIALIGASVLLSLDGCSTIKNAFTAKPVDYQHTQQANALEVPPDLTAPTADGHFQVSDGNAPGSATYSAYSASQQGSAATTATAPIATESTRDNADTVLPTPAPTVHMEHSDCERWLVVNQPADKVWPVLVKFWQDNGFALIRNDAKIGILQTDWKDDASKLPQDVIHNTLGKVLPGMYSSAQKNQFRTRIERDAAHPDQTEIYVTERSVVETTNNNFDGTHTQWQPSAADPGAEAEMLTRLMQQFGLDKPQAQALLTQNAPSGLAHIAHRSDGRLMLQDDEAFDHAWRRVGLALDHIGYNVVDRDRTKGVYLITEAETALADKKSTGFWSKLEFWNHVGNNVTQYQVELDENPAATRTDVRILDEKGNPAADDLTGRIINKLLDQLK